MIFDRNQKHGFAGIIQAVISIIALICAGAKIPHIKIISGGIKKRQKTKTGRATEIFYFVQSRVTYEPDPENIEKISTAERVLIRGYGDCDDYTVLIGALARAAGLRVRVTIVQSNNSKEYNHVYPEIESAGAWLPLDPTIKDARPFYIPREKIKKSISYLVPEVC